MIVIYIILIAAGALPLVLFIYKRKNYRHILSTGTKVNAKVMEVKRMRYTKGPEYDRLWFWYLPIGASQYEQGMLRETTGKFRSGDEFALFYLPEKPSKYAIPGPSHLDKWVFLALLLLLAICIYGSFQIHEMVGHQEITFNP